MRVPFGHSTGIADAEILSLLQLLRAPQSGDFRWVPGVYWDWRPFAAACDAHQIAPLIFCRLRDFPQDFVPSGLLEYLRARFYEVSARNYHLASKLVELTALLEGHDIPALAYKGPAVAMAIYGDLALRQYEDLDLVIPKEHLSRALNLLTQRGFRITPYSSRGGFHYVPYSIRPENPRHLAKYHVVTLQAPDKTFFVDLHWHLANESGRAFCPDIEKVWDRAERLELPQGSVSTLCHEDLLSALCYHGTKHRWSCLKWLLDVAELFRRTETLDWSRIQEMIADRPGVAASTTLAVLLARDLLGVTVVTEVTKTLPITQRTVRLAAAIRDEILLQGRANENDHATLPKLKGSLVAWMKRLCIDYPGWWLDAVFGQVSPKDRALISLPEKVQFLYHFIRPARLAVKYAKLVSRVLWLFTIAKKSLQHNRAN